MEDREILKEIKGHNLYNFIAKNYYRMNTEQLKDIILEILIQFEGKEYDNLLDNLAENLIEYRDWEE